MIGDFFRDTDVWSHSDLDVSSDIECFDDENLVDDTLLFENDLVQEYEAWYVPEGEDSWQFDDIGNPIEDADCWQQQEGQNSCAVIAQIGVYESITGVEISEADACQIAEANGWFDPEIGTYPEDIGKILNQWGISTEQSYNATLDDIATALEQGDKVIVGLDANEIWTPTIDPTTGFPVEQFDTGHAVWVTGIEQQPNGSVKIILNDSGTPDGQMKAVDAEDFLNAWADYDNFLTVADAPVSVGAQQFA